MSVIFSSKDRNRNRSNVGTILEFWAPPSHAYKRDQGDRQTPMVYNRGRNINKGWSSVGF